MILKALGALDAIAGLLALTDMHAYSACYLILKSIVFLSLSPTCVLNWCDFALGLLLLFFYSQTLALVVFLYLIFKGIASFM